MNESCTSDTGDGTYQMFRDRIVFTWFNGSELAFAYAVDSDGRHTLTPDEKRRRETPSSGRRIPGNGSTTEINRLDNGRLAALRR